MSDPIIIRVFGTVTETLATVDVTVAGSLVNHTVIIEGDADTPGHLLFDTLSADNLKLRNIALTSGSGITAGLTLQVEGATIAGEMSCSTGCSMLTVYGSTISCDGPTACVSTDSASAGAAIIVANNAFTTASGDAYSLYHSGAGGIDIVGNTGTGAEGTVYLTATAADAAMAEVYCVSIRDRNPGMDQGSVVYGATPVVCSALGTTTGSFDSELLNATSSAGGSTAFSMAADTIPGFYRMTAAASLPPSYATRPIGVNLAFLKSKPFAAGVDASPATLLNTGSCDLRPSTFVGSTAADWAKLWGLNGTTTYPLWTSFRSDVAAVAADGSVSLFANTRLAEDSLSEYFAPVPSNHLPDTGTPTYWDAVLAKDATGEVSLTYSRAFSLPDLLACTTFASLPVLTAMAVADRIPESAADALETSTIGYNRYGGVLGISTRTPAIYIGETVADYTITTENVLMESDHVFQFQVLGENSASTTFQTTNFGLEVAVRGVEKWVADKQRIIFETYVKKSAGDGRGGIWLVPSSALALSVSETTVIDGNYYSLTGPDYQSLDGSTSPCHTADSYDGTFDKDTYCVQRWYINPSLDDIKKFEFTATITFKAQFGDEGLLEGEDFDVTVSVDFDLGSTSEDTDVQIAKSLVPLEDNVYRSTSVGTDGDAFNRAGLKLMDFASSSSDVAFIRGDTVILRMALDVPEVERNIWQIDLQKIDVCVYAAEKEGEALTNYSSNSVYWGCESKDSTGAALFAAKDTLMAEGSAVSGSVFASSFVVTSEVDSSGADLAYSKWVAFEAAPLTGTANSVVVSVLYDVILVTGERRRLTGHLSFGRNAPHPDPSSDMKRPQLEMVPGFNPRLAHIDAAHGISTAVASGSGSSFSSSVSEKASGFGMSFVVCDSVQNVRCQVEIRKRTLEAAALAAEKAQHVTGDGKFVGVLDPDYEVPLSDKAVVEKQLEDYNQVLLILIVCLSIVGLVVVVYVFIMYVWPRLNRRDMKAVAVKEPAGPSSNAGGSRSVAFAATAPIAPAYRRVPDCV